LSRFQHGLRVLAGGLVFVGFIAGCSDFAQMITPGSKTSAGPALVSVSTSVASSVGAASDVVTLKVVAQYLRHDGSAVQISGQSLPLSSSATQQVPVAVELATCLADPDHDRVEGAKNTCRVLLNLALVVNGVVVDEQVVGPLGLAPGATTPVSQSVSLYEITSVDVSVGDGAVLSPSDEISAVLDGTLALSAKIRDRSGRTVTGRSVLWSSDAPGVATVGVASGIVSVIGLGTAHVTASIGTVSRTVSMRAIRRPAALTVRTGLGNGDGTVRSAPTGIDCRVSGPSVSGACSFTFPGDATVQLTSTPDDGSVFELWGDACTVASVGTVCTVTMDQPQATSVRFSALRRISIAGEGGNGRGRVVSTSGLDCRIDGEQASGICSIDAVEGTRLTLTATPEPSGAGVAAHSFGGWGGECAAAPDNSCTVVVPASNRTVTVRFFHEQQVRLVVVGSGGGQIAWGDGTFCADSAGQPSGVCVRGLQTGQTVTLTAIAGPKSVFVGWSGDCEQQSGTSCTTTVSQARTVRAIFTPLRRITIGAGAADGRGRVTGSSGLDCRIGGGQSTGVCSVDVADGVSLVLTAAVEPSTVRQVFADWSGSCSSEAGLSCTVVATGGDRTVLPRFFDARQLQLQLTGNGIGRVLWSDGSVCARRSGTTSGVCAQVDAYGTTVTLTATADPQSKFAGWTGDCERQFGTSCLTTLTQSRSINATFVKKPVALNLSIDGTAAGAIAVDGQSACALPPGQTTGSCVLSYAVDTPVSITGVPASHVRFMGFGGDCSGTSACKVALYRETTVSARFDPEQYALSVQISGPGSGTITIDGSPFCSLARGQGSVTCTRLVDYGSTVQLVGAAGSGPVLLGLGGDCAGANPCTLQITKDAQATAVFADRVATLSVLLLGEGDGNVRTLGAIDCTRSGGRLKGTCTEDVTLGTSVTLTATPPSGGRFVKWGGACKEQVGTTCTVAMPESHTVTATFEKRQ
jgi:hypothetical protein